MFLKGRIIKILSNIAMVSIYCDWRPFNQDRDGYFVCFSRRLNGTHLHQIRTNSLSGPNNFMKCQQMSVYKTSVVSFACVTFWNHCYL